jgi:KRAB domain-containing zinc finger protein
MTFRTVRAVKNHYYGSHGKFACQHCLQYYDTGRILEDHIKTTHMITCPTCKELFLTPFLLDRHKRAKHPPLHFCLACPESFSSQEELTAHELTHIRTCDVCQAIFSDDITLRDHARVHQPIECLSCKEIFTTKQELRTHRKLKHEKKSVSTETYNCKQCDLSFNSDLGLQEHGKVHINDQSCVCVYCDRNFPNGLSLHKHMESHFTLGYLCQQCSANFHSLRRLKLHLKLSHSRIWLFKCRICRKKYLNYANMLCHISFHEITSVKKCFVKRPAFQCEECNNLYSSKAYLEHHISKHRQKRNEIIDIINRL